MSENCVIRFDSLPHVYCFLLAMLSSNMVIYCLIKFLLHQNTMLASNTSINTTP